MLSLGCDEEPKTPTASAEAPPHPAAPGKVEPAPPSPLALGRAVVDALQRDDWEGYTNLLATRADMMALYADTDRGEGRKRRKRRRMVWRRVNRLRDGEAEDGWKTVRREAERDGMAWDAARLVDVRRERVSAERLPPGAEAVVLHVVLEHHGVLRVLDIGTCARSTRGWVALYPLAWQHAREGEPRGESLLGPAP